MVELAAWSLSKHRTWDMEIDGNHISIHLVGGNAPWHMSRAQAVELCELLGQLRPISADAQAAMDGG